MRYRIESFVLKVGAALAAGAFATAASVGAADLTPQEKKLIPLAKKEGAVTIINPLFSDATATRMAEVFKKRYGLGDDFKFNNLRKGTGATVAQVRQEIKAGRFTVGVREARQRLLEEPHRARQERRSIFELSVRGRSPCLHLPAGLEQLLPGHGEFEGDLVRGCLEAQPQGKDHRVRPDQERDLHQHDDLSHGSGHRHEGDFQ
jgi:hypothetical protein